MKKILIFSESYLPGIKGGGPITSIRNMVIALSLYYELWIVTLNYDYNSENSIYEGIIPDKWHKDKYSKILYLSKEKNRIKNIIRIFRDNSFDYIYLNSFFSFNFSIRIIILRDMGLIPCIPIVLAIRGEFDRNALNYKRLKKKVFLLLAMNLKLYENVKWQVSNLYEYKDAVKIVKNVLNINVISNISIAPDIALRIEEKENSRFKNVNQLKLIYLSRIHSEKNLLFALKILNSISGEIQFQICGPIEDEKYWDNCLTLIGNLRDNIKVTYRGIIKRESIYNTLLQNHVLLFPTKNENFGHIIYEALAVGLPIIISDRTPWKGLLRKGVGYDIPLNKPELFVEAINIFLEMDDVEFRKWTNRAKEYSKKISQDTTTIEKYQGLFS